MSQEPREELAALRHLLIALESGSMTIRQSGEDVTQRELAKIEPEIKYLETVLARSHGVK